MKTEKRDCKMQLSELLPGHRFTAFGSSSRLAALLSLPIVNSADSVPLSICQQLNPQDRHVTLTILGPTFRLMVELDWDAVDTSVYGRKELAKLTLTVKP